MCLLTASRHGFLVNSVVFIAVNLLFMFPSWPSSTLSRIYVCINASKPNAHIFAVVIYSVKPSHCKPPLKSTFLDISVYLMCCQNMETAVRLLLEIKGTS